MHPQRRSALARGVFRFGNEPRKAAIQLRKWNGGFVRTPDLLAKNFEGPLLSPRALDLEREHLSSELGLDILTVPETLFRRLAEVYAILDVLAQGRSISITA